MAMTKREFAARLLFWLFPWPISSALPRALRIYYFGPGAAPPPGFYDYWGVPINLWPDAPPYDEFIEDPPDDPPPWWPPDMPPYDEFIEDPPDEQPPWWDPSWPPYDEFIEDPPDNPPPWWPPIIPPYDDFIEDPPDDPPPWYPIDPYNPPPPDQFPDPGPAPSPDPWPPSPGPPPGPTPQPIAPAGWMTMFDDTYWQTDDQAAWNVDHWDFLGTFAVSIKPTGEWSRGFRPTKWRVTHDYGAGLRLTLVNAGEPGWASAVVIVSGVAYDCDFEGASDADITGAELDSGAGGCNFDITNIEFFA